MKLWALLPIFVEVALALPPSAVYKRHRGQVKHYKDEKNVSHCSHGTPPSGLPPYNSYHIPSHTLSHTPRPTTTTSSTTPPPTTTPSGNDGGNSTSQSDIQAYLDAHNTIRAKHHAAPLTWSSTLASAAETWAKRCVFEHSHGSIGNYGENLSAGSGQFTIADAIKLWTDEESQYNPASPQYSHYTQMVWKSTTEVGCAVASCNLSNFAPEFWPAKFYVCEYNPPGNVEGQFGDNVE